MVKRRDEILRHMETEVAGSNPVHWLRPVVAQLVERVIVHLSRLDLTILEGAAEWSATRFEPWGICKG